MCSGQDFGFTFAAMSSAPNGSLTLDDMCSGQNVVFSLAGICCDQNVGLHLLACVVVKMFV
jgi:hypothetical protein